jgi:pyrroline-5-carboxylate reductase
MKYGFIGGGNMGGAMAKAAAAVVGGANVLLCDRDEATTAALADKLGVTASSYEEIAAGSRLIFVAVKPNLVASVLEKLRDMLQARKSETCVVSIAAGVTIATMTGILGEDIPLIRMMQNTPVAVGEGVLVYACAPSANEADAAALEASMAAAGKIEPLPEKLIDAATAVMGCGPAFVYMFAEALADGGVACGLPRAQAQTYAAQTLLGAAKMLLETGEHPGALKDAVCSPGGSTIQGVRVLEENGLRGATIDAVIAAYQKTQGLG